MSRRRSRGKPVDGVLLLDKPRGITSQAAVSRVKRAFGAAKAGHTGTLDPLADGLLPVCLGEATKFAQGLLDADKSYRAVVRLGVRTATGDLEGAVLETRQPAVTREALASALARFRGDVVQVPPMYSALKRDGKPLYEYARAGEEVSREPRRVRIDSLDLEAVDGDDFTIVVRCSKGTYIRVLAEDIGTALGCGACLAALTRTAVGRLDLEDAVGLAALEALPAEQRHERLLPADALASDLPRVELEAVQVDRLLRGQPIVLAPGPAEGRARAYAPGGRFLGLVACDGQGGAVPFRLVSTEAIPAHGVENAGNA